MTEYREYFSQDNDFYKITPVVKGLMIVYGVVFCVQAFFFLSPLHLDLRKYLGLDPFQVIEKLHFWQIFTYMFLHENIDPGGIFSLLSTYITLYFCGTELESYLGRKRFLYFYLLCGIFSALLGLLVYPFYPQFKAFSTPAPVLYGVLCLYAFLYPYRVILFMFVFPIKAKNLILLLLLIYAYSFFWTHHLAVVCLLGGGLFGYLYYRYEPKLQGFFERFEEKQYEVETINENQIRQKVDDLLEKISNEGIGKLTRKEKNFLKKASKQFKNNGLL